MSRRVHLSQKQLGVVALIFLLLPLGLALVHPFGNVRHARRENELMKTATIEAPVLGLMQRACQNCHSERTEWPWYSHAAPISWLIESDVNGGRSHWNMSKWEQYSIEVKEQILSQIGPMVRNRKMPVPQYLFLHPEAKLSDADVDLIYQWTRRERKRLKAAEIHP